MTPPSVLGQSAFWAQLLERAGRQAAQTALPIVAAASASAGGLNWKAAVIALLTAIAVTVLKALVTVRVSPFENRYWQLLDRAVPAAAGTLLGFVPVDAADVVNVDWDAVVWAAVGAAATALLAYYVTPPADVVEASVTTTGPTGPDVIAAPPVDSLPPGAPQKDDYSGPTVVPPDAPRGDAPIV